MKGKEKQDEIAKAKDFQGFYDELAEESDRGAALLAGAFLDNHLAALLEAFFIDDEPHKKGAPSEVEKLLYEPTAPLGTFSSRAKAAYCLGLISHEDLKDIELIKDIRNRFAHRLHGYSFSTPTIEAMCRRLSLPQRLKPPIPIPFFDEPRALFLTAVSVHINQLAVNCLKVAAKDKRQLSRPTAVQVLQV